MSERNYYVLCDSGCKFPAMTAEQTLAAIAEATGKTAVNVNEAFISSLKEQNAGSGLKFWIGTTAEYNALGDNKVNNCLYILTDDTTAADFNTAVERLQARDKELATALAVANAETNNALAAVNNELSGKIVEAETRLNEKIDNVDEWEQILVSPTHGEQTTVPADNSVIDVSGTLLFSRRGNIARVEIDVNFDAAYNKVTLKYTDMDEAPEGFIPAKSQSGMLISRADHDDIGHYTAAATINSTGIIISAPKASGTDTEQCNWYGEVIYFL